MKHILIIIITSVLSSQALAQINCPPCNDSICNDSICSSLFLLDEYGKTINISYKPNPFNLLSKRYTYNPKGDIRFFINVVLFKDGVYIDSVTFLKPIKKEDELFIRNILCNTQVTIDQDLEWPYNQDFFENKILRVYSYSNE